MPSQSPGGSESIHPFLNGSGRLARLLIVRMLIDAGVRQQGEWQARISFFPCGGWPGSARRCPPDSDGRLPVVARPAPRASCSQSTSGFACAAQQGCGTDAQTRDMEAGLIGRPAIARKAQVMPRPRFTSGLLARQGMRRPKISRFLISRNPLRRQCLTATRTSAPRWAR